ncbi:MAG TPA: histidine/lysine/arginine/ornithine ABC transporter ATP-binding protein, partial [Pantoea sp.]|nr:histidine/lysine/arginine/ornithine ABC transporter ATP-binding protein [Pantoea sp.]
CQGEPEAMFGQQGSQRFKQFISSHHAAGQPS